MDVAAIALHMVAGALLNAGRGAAFKPDWLKGHSRYWYGALTGLFLCLDRHWWDALIIAACLVWWAQWPWGRWYTLHRCPRKWSGMPNAFERIVERLCDIGGVENDHLCLLARMVFGLAPLAVYTLSPWPLVAAFGIVVAYELAWRFGQDGRQIRTAEALTGALLGALLSII